MAKILNFEAPTDISPSSPIGDRSRDNKTLGEKYRALNQRYNEIMTRQFEILEVMKNASPENFGDHVIDAVMKLQHELNELRKTLYRPTERRRILDELMKVKSMDKEFIALGRELDKVGPLLVELETRIYRMGGPEVLTRILRESGLEEGEIKATLRLHQRGSNG